MLILSPFYISKCKSSFIYISCRSDVALILDSLIALFDAALHVELQYTHVHVVQSCYSFSELNQFHQKSCQKTRRGAVERVRPQEEQKKERQVVANKPREATQSK